MEIEIKEKVKLLDSNHHLTSPGWARHMLWQYSRKDTGVSWAKIKEWDYYQIVNPEKRYAINITFSDLGLYSLISLSYIDFDRKAFAQESALKFLTRGKSGLKASPDEDGEVTYANEKITVTFVKKGEARRIIANTPSLILPDGSTGLIVDLTLSDPPSESVNIASSWKEDRTKFYLNEKRGPMRVEGHITSSMKRERIENSYALLDWGRGVWLRSSTWVWAALMDSSFLINLGGGFTDRSNASENAIVYNGVVHKIADVDITIPDDLDNGDWHFKDKEGRLDLTMKAVVNRSDHLDYKVISSLQDQVFGLYSGYFILDNGEKIIVSDQLGFAEKVANKW